MQPSDLQREKEEALLRSLAMAMVEHPKATLLELAKAAGIGRITLYNFCRTREKLLERLFSYGLEIVHETLEAVKIDTAPPMEVLRKMAERSFKDREITAFMTRYWKLEHEAPPPDLNWEARLDTFFLRGQQEGVFRIDIPASALCEIWLGIHSALVDAERRGRVARVGMVDLLEYAFLQGAAPVNSKVLA